MLPSVLPTETDHVPVLADEVLTALAPHPGDTIVDCTFGAGGHSALLAARLRGDGKLIAIDRDPMVTPYFERLRRSTTAKVRLLHGEFSQVLEQLASNGVQADAILLDLGVSSMQLDRPERGFSYAADAALDMRMDPSAELTARDIVNDAAERDLAEIFRRYGEERYARQIARAIVRRRGKQPFERTGDLVEVVKQAIPAPARFGEGGQRRARLARAGVAGSARDAATGRTARRDLLPLARGPHRQALSPRRGARLHVSARVPCLRLRREPDAARDAAPRDPSVRCRDLPQPPLAIGAPPRGGEAWLSRELQPRSPSPRQAARARGRSRARRRAGARAAAHVRVPRSSGSRSARFCSPASSSSTSRCSGST